MSVLELNGRVFDASTTGTLTLTSEGGAATTDVTQGLAKAWCHWNQTDHSVDNSFNQSSMDDLGTGQSAINFTSLMTALDYAAYFEATPVNNNHGGGFPDMTATSTSSKLACRHYENNGLQDAINAFSTIHGDLA